MMTQTEPNLDKAFDLLNLELKIFKPHASDFEKFCKALNDYLKKLPALEHDQEKPIEQVFTRFLQDAFTEYTDKYVVRSVEDIDLTICVKSAKRPSVLIECKKPSETKDFPRNSHLNVKALHQLIYYYLKETIEHHNTGIKSLIITNGKELYIFDEATFNRCFGEKYNKILKQEYNHNKVGKRGTDEFYTVMKRYLEENPEILEKLTLLHFSIESLSQELQKPEPLKSRRLQKAYKALCKFSLLKEALPNTGNTLNQAFYDELLHIIGLEEVKADGKKLIQRKQNTPESASLIESILSQNKASFAQHTTPQNRDDKVIELVITWVNRILFLKLLEAQLVRYHKGNQTFKFMGEKYLTDWDHVNQLFFDVLAIKEQERHPNKRVQDLHFVPYLNSSLFERSELEQQLGTINNLTENELGLHPKTVLKHHVKRRTGTMRNIDYLLSFLDAYDFGSDTEDDGVQHNDKTLINASVLGLVFEKINGYKEGSFYTPSVITMYMCKESLRLAVIQKLNEAFDWQHSEWQDLKMACVNLRTEEKIKASNVINQLKICDPAVGSGHFLVSALNELLAIKADLELLVKDGIVRRLDIRIVNDELVIQDDNDEAPFQYHVSLDGLTQKRSVAKRKQTIQELLFDEKRTLIEQCLFGVDINPNSVQICRLRLWIELLKNTYYKSETAYKELETLPNIDINIKCGNSLISKFGIREKISLSVKDASHVKDLQTLSKSYHHAKEKSFKADITHRIQEIKASFKNKCIEGTTEYVDRTKLRKKLEGLEHKVIELTGILKDEYRLGFFPDDEIDNMKRELVKKRLDLTKQKNALKKADARVEESIKNPLFSHAFEWRFEFPDVLHPETGDFEGFDVVIGNPPYMRIQEIEKYAPAEKKYYADTYKSAIENYELANVFYERSMSLLKANGIKSFIMPHKFLNTKNGKGLRNYINNEKCLTKLLHFGANMIFDSATTYTAIVFSQKKVQKDFVPQIAFYKVPSVTKLINHFDEIMFDFSETPYSAIVKNADAYGVDNWILFNTEQEQQVFQKIYQKNQKVETLFEEMFVGLQTSGDDVYILHDCVINEDATLTGIRKQGKQTFKTKAYRVETAFFKPFLMGKNVRRYETLQTDKYVFFPYRLEDEKAVPVTLQELKEHYPLTYAYVMDNETHFKARESGKAGKQEHWFGYIYPKNLTKFEQPKLSSMEICTSHPNVTLNNNNLYHTTKVYSWVKKESCHYSYEYLLAFLNSKVFWWFLMSTGDTLQGDARTIKTNYVNPFPIPQATEAQQAPLVARVNEILALHASLLPKGGGTEHEVKARIDSLEAEIDVLVYQLYQLTYDDVRVIDPTFAMPRGAYESGLALLGYTTLEGFNMNQAD